MSMQSRPAAPARPVGPPGGRGHGPMSMGVPGEKSMDFRGSSRRLLGVLAILVGARYLWVGLG